MPKYDYFSITNQTLKLETQNFLFYVFHQSRIGTRQRSEISHLLLVAVSNLNREAVQNFALLVDAVRNRINAV